MVDTVIFDFDGVIADSGAIFTETLEEVLNRSEPFSEAEIKHMRNSSPRAIIKFLGIKKWQIPRVIAKGRKGVAARMHTVKVFDNMPEAIKELHAQDYKMYIVSNNSQEAINHILEQYDLQECITHIYSVARMFGKAKKLRYLLRKEHLRKDQCVYVGDEVRDVEASKQIGIKCVAVEWGYSAPEALTSYNPDAMVSTPKQLLTVLKGL